ncbi:hypothetical protein [Streptomyces sp. RFCAC02]|uniref:hypothetical protein n=1 Tax=Streptomyces sp. RFCAC02 TaxID=2499143 RepID=UPI0010219354|nr:hypothetical protein [Streptomyces sp. RFCAC02]
MARSVLVRCPDCHREHTYVPPEFPCVCGAPVPLPVLTSGVAPAISVRHRSWSAAWTEVDCTRCGHQGQWPQPQFDCSCGVTVRLTLRDGVPAGGGEGREPFGPVAIETAWDGVACAAEFLGWLGFWGVRGSVPRPPSGLDLRGPSIVGVVDQGTERTGVRRVETLWLHAATANALPVAFAVAGFEMGARVCADDLRVPLFVLELSGTPRAVNTAAERLVADGAPDRGE